MKYLLSLCFVLLATLVSAQEPLPVAPVAVDEPSRLQRFGDRFHLETTEYLVSLSEDLDSFFPNPDNRRFDYRRTRLLAKIGMQVDSKGKVLALQRLSGRIVLPRMEERLSLYFNGVNDELNPTDDVATPNFFFFPNIEDTHFRFGFNTALRFIFTKSDFYLVQNQLGVRLLPRVDPYEEISAQLRIPFKRFLWQPGQSFFWRRSSGFGATTRFDLDYALRPRAIIRWHEDVTISEVTNGYEHRHSLAFMHQLRESRGYVVAIEARGETSPIQQITQYVIGFTWKDLVYKDWFYIETGISTRFADAESFEPVPAIFFALSADFDGRKSKPPPTLPRAESPASPL